MANKTIGNLAGVTAVRGSGNEVQTLRGTAASGTFALQFGGLETAAIAFNAAAATIQTALRNLANISATGVTCAGGALGTAPVTVSFENEFAGADVELLKVRSIDLAGGTVTIEDTTDAAAFFDSDMSSIAAMRTRLTAISGTTYTAAVLNTMTYNDMVYALRMQDAPTSVK